MSRITWGAVALALAGMVGVAAAQTAPTGSGLAPGSATPGISPAPRGAPTSAAHPQPTPGALRMSAEADAARRMTDERLRRRDAAARRSMQGICKGC